MSRFARLCATAAIGAALVGGTAAGQIIPGVALPPVSVPMPAPAANVPIAGPVLQNVLSDPQVQQQVVSGGLNSVGGLPDMVAGSGAPTLLDLRNLRLEELIRSNRAQLEADERGEPIRRGVLIAVDPDPVSLQLAARAGFRIIAN